MEHFIVLGMDCEIGVIAFMTSNTVSLGVAACTVWVSNVIGVFAMERDPMDFVVNGYNLHCGMAVNTALWHSLNCCRITALFFRNGAVTAFARGFAAEVSLVAEVWHQVCDSWKLHLIQIVVADFTIFFDGVSVAFATAFVVKCVEIIFAGGAFSHTCMTAFTCHFHILNMQTMGKID